MKKFSDYLVNNTVTESNDEYDTTTSNILKAFESAGFKVKFNDKTMSGDATLSAMKVKFDAGGENLYLTLPEVHTKQAPKETINALKDFLKVIKRCCYYKSLLCYDLFVRKHKGDFS